MCATCFPATQLGPSLKLFCPMKYLRSEIWNGTSHRNLYNFRCNIVTTNIDLFSTQWVLLRYWTNIKSTYNIMMIYYIISLEGDAAFTWIFISHFCAKQVSECANFLPVRVFLITKEALIIFRNTFILTIHLPLSLYPYHHNHHLRGMSYINCVCVFHFPPFLFAHI